MAKQNFVSGGFYGKLGSLVGQRWKNKRTVRAYAIPKNPRTEKQQANRHTFGVLTANAQLGQQMNFKAPCFTSEDKTEWGLRMSQASKLLKAGQQNMNLIPLFPEGYSPAFQITECLLMSRPSDTSVKIRLKGNLPTDSRSISVLVAFYDSALTGYDFELYNAKTTVAENTEFVIENTIASKYDATTRMLIVSNDDASNSNAMLYGAEVALKIYAKTRRKFNFGSPTVQTSKIAYDSDSARYSMTTTIIFEEPYATSDQEIKNFAIKGVKNGAFKTISYDSISFTDQDGKFGLAITASNTNPAQIIAYPTGSALSIGSLNIETDTEILTGENETFEISNTDLQRTFKSQVTDTAQSGKTITFTVGETLPTIDTVSGAVSLHSVKAGRFTDESLNVSAVGGSSISVEISDASGINQNALPSGSTVVIDIQIESEGVAYTPTVKTAQNVITSDLARTFTEADGAKVESATGFEIVFPLYVDDFAFTPISLDQYETLKPFVGNAKVSTYEAIADKDAESNLRWKVAGHAGDFINNKTFAPPASYKANGVTYSITPKTYESDITEDTPFNVIFTSDDYTGVNTVTQNWNTIDPTFEKVTGLTLDDLVAMFEIEDYKIRNPPLWFRGTTEDGEEVEKGRFSSVQLCFYSLGGGEVEIGINYAEYNGVAVETIDEVAGSADLSQVGVVEIPIQNQSSNPYARKITLRFE